MPAKPENITNSLRIGSNVIPAFSRAGGATAGETDEFGIKSLREEIPLRDVHATILNLLGLNDQRLTYLHAGRYRRLTDIGGQVLQQIIASVKSVLEETPPELASDVIDKGMVLSGGGALLRNMDKLLTQVTGVPCHVAENALNCVALGTGEALKHYDFFKKSLVSSF